MCATSASTTQDLCLGKVCVLGEPHLHILDLGLGEQQLLVVVPLPLLTFCLQLQHGLLGIGESLPQVCNLGGTGDSGNRADMYAVIS